MRKGIYLLLAVSVFGCAGPAAQVSRLREENAQLAERIRQDQIRVQNLETQNEQLQSRLADAEKSVAALHESQANPVLRR